MNIVVFVYWLLDMFLIRLVRFQTYLFYYECTACRYFVCCVCACCLVVVVATSQSNNTDDMDGNPKYKTSPPAIDKHLLTQIKDVDVGRSEVRSGTTWI